MNPSEIDNNVVIPLLTDYFIAQSKTALGRLPRFNFSV
jgi:hypothetical protein